jgi:hypothetical protein
MEKGSENLDDMAGQLQQNLENEVVQEVRTLFIMHKCMYVLYAYINTVQYIHTVLVCFCCFSNLMLFCKT